MNRFQPGTAGLIVRSCGVGQWGGVAELIVALCAAICVTPVYGDDVADSTVERPRYDPITAYAARELSGWHLLVHRKLEQDEPELWNEVGSLLEHQFFQIEREVPKPAVEKLRKITIWVELNEPHHPCMVYHPDAVWLRGHDMHPEKSGCVELANARNFLKWTHDQPWMVLHELAHGYHHQFVEQGFQNAEVAQALAAAASEKLYDSVLRFNGKDERAYAAVNPMEYFAEQTEAFFGTNDFYPFVRSELRRHDPRMHALLRKLWQVE